MITKEIVNNELYVFIFKDGKKSLLYKRWINRQYGMVMDTIPFTAKDIDNIKNKLNETKKQT
jgi:hypothetical protein